MKNLNLYKNNRGLYLLDNELDKDNVLINTKNEMFSAANFCVEDQEEQRYFIKFAKYATYIMNVCGEVLFNKIAEKNGYKSAKVAGAQFKTGEYAVISKDVVDKDSEYFSCEELFDMMKISYKQDRASVKSIAQTAMAFSSENEDLKTDPNLWQDLYKLAIVDLLTNQDDRNFQNIMFEIKHVDGQKILCLCPPFDNEGIFDFAQMGGEEVMFSLFDKNVVLDNKTKEQITEIFNMSIDECEMYRGASLLGIRTDLADKFSSIEDEKRNLRGDFSKEKNLFYQELAEVLHGDPELMKFAKGFKFDALEYGEEIKKETGFEIPKALLQCAQYQFDARKRDLDLCIENYRGMEKK